MSLRDKINRSLLLAWNQLKDLAVPATLIQRTSSDFDFSTGTITSPTSTNVPLKVVMLQAAKTKRDSTTDTQLQCLFKMRDSGALNHYDGLVVGLDTYRIASASIINNGFIVTATLEKI